MSTGDTWQHLNGFGYAPGDYMNTCHRCENVVSGVDKRAITCRPCAEQLLIESQAAQIAALKTVMVAAAEEIAAHWNAHCDAEGYGPQNLLRRLEEGIPSEYGYTAGAFAELKAKAEARAVPEAALRYLRDTAQTGTPNEQAVARTVMHLLAATPSPAEQPKLELGDRFMEIFRAIHGDMPDDFADSARLAFAHALREQSGQPTQTARVALSDEQILAIVKVAPALDSAEAEWLYVTRAVIAEYERINGIAPAAPNVGIEPRRKASARIAG